MAGFPLGEVQERLEDPVKAREDVLKTHQQSSSRKHTRSQQQHQSGGEFLMNQDEVFELGEWARPFGALAQISACSLNQQIFLECFLGAEHCARR